MATHDDLAGLYKALSHPKRLAILETLKDGELCVCEIEEMLDLRQSYVSQQLTVLRQAGLVCFRKEGWNALYRIARPEVHRLIELAGTIQDQLGVCATADETSASGASPCCVTEMAEPARVR